VQAVIQGAPPLPPWKQTDFSGLVSVPAAAFVAPVTLEALIQGAPPEVLPPPVPLGSRIIPVPGTVIPVLPPVEPGIIQAPQAEVPPQAPALLASRVIPVIPVIQPAPVPLVIQAPLPQAAEPPVPLGSRIVPPPAAALPAGRNLLISIASMAGVDDYGNTYPQGIQVGAAGAPQVQMLPAQGTAAEITFPVPAPALSNVANIAGGSNGSAANLLMSGPALAESGVNDWMQLALFSNDGDGTASMQWIYVNIEGAAQLLASLAPALFTIQIPVSITGGLAATGLIQSEYLEVSSIAEVGTLIVGGQELTIPQPAPSATAAAIIAALQEAGIFS
jgi:hypothetical protein